MNYFKKSFFLIVSIILVLGLSISFQSLLAAWTGPAANPPTCASGNAGCDAPINIGSATQSKAGNFGVTGTFAVGNNMSSTGSTFNLAQTANAHFYFDANKGVQIRLDADNNDSSTFQINNGANITVWSMDENGTLNTGTIPWARLSSYPSACAAGQYVTAIGGSLSCGTPSFSESGDAVVGNEVTNAANSTLTRSGSGTAGSPYTLGLNLNNANTWTNTQTFSAITINGTSALSSTQNINPYFYIDSDEGVQIRLDADNNDSSSFSINNGINSTVFSVDESGNLFLSGTVDGSDISSKVPSWDSAYNERRQWDGGASNLNAAAGRSSLGLGSLATLSSISGANITDSTITSSDIADGTITGADINNSSVQQRITGSCAVGSSIRVINANGTVACQSGGTGTVTSITAGNGLSGGTITTSGTISLNTANANAWTAAQTFNGQINANGGLCISGDCKTSWSQVGTKERIVQKVTRTGTWPGYNCASAGGDTADGNPCSQDLYKCTRADALANRSVIDVFGTSSWDASDRIECSMQYTSDTSNSIQIEINEPSDTYYGCADYNLQDYCGDTDGCHVFSYGQHKASYSWDDTYVQSAYIYMEQPDWSKNRYSGIFGATHEPAYRYFVNGIGRNDIVMVAAAGYILNYRYSYCGGDNTGFSSPYVFRFITGPLFRSKFIIYDNPD